MRGWLRRLGMLSVLVPAGLASGSVWADDDPQAGLKLFQQRWATHDSRSPTGDGLGPMHNATSCAACHNQGGVGGGGGLEHNVEMLSLVPIRASANEAENFTKRVLALHPGFRVGTSNVLRSSVVLHRFGPEGDYYDFRARLLGIEELRADADPGRRAVQAVSLAKRRKARGAFVEKLPEMNGISFLLSQRNTPALWGAGLIDSIPSTVIAEYAQWQKREAPKVAGQPPIAADGSVGRFGWRGQTSTLEQFVLGACANELGLQTEGNEQAVNPLAPSYKVDGEDMSADHVQALVAFVANLPRPVQADAANEKAAQALQYGENVFNRIGCAACHPRQMSIVDGLFSDLLLHDLGSGLADPVEPVNPSSGANNYYGTGSVFIVEGVRRDPTLPNQWRTPPLWGVNDSAPYMHDGRAASLLDAIKMHGGQGSIAANNFADLSSEDRASVINFLRSLIAPHGRDG